MTDQVRMEDPPRSPDRQAQRRATRREANRSEILDAAEEVFGQDGVRDGSLRKIAVVSGFSTAAIYLFFANKQDLVVETLTRRGIELLAEVTEAAGGDEEPPATELAKLHRIVDVTVAFFRDRPHFRNLLRHVRGGPTIIGPVLGAFDPSDHTTFDDVMTVLADLVRAGQQTGEIRDGDPRVLAHLYSVLINEFVLLATTDQATTGALTSVQFHGLIDGALRAPKAPSRSRKT